jgi:DNA-binding transcriptional LysR family regulator
VAQLGEVRFGLDPLCAGIFLADLLAFLGEHHVDLKVEASVDAATELERRLLNHEADLAIVPGQLLSNPEQIEQLPLLTVQVALLVRPGHPLLARKSVTLDDLAGYPFIAGSSPKEVERLAINHPLWRAATIRCDDYGLMGDVVMNGNAIWMASAALASRGGNQALVQLRVDEQTPMPETDIVVASLKGLSPSPATVVLRDQLVKLAESLR